MYEVCCYACFPCARAELYEEGFGILGSYYRVMLEQVAYERSISVALSAVEVGPCSCRYLGTCDELIKFLFGHILKSLNDAKAVDSDRKSVVWVVTIEYLTIEKVGNPRPSSHTVTITVHND